MIKFYVSKDELNDEELRTGRVSYMRIVERFIGDLLLCNNIVNIDDSIWDNSTGIVDTEYDEYPEIYQYYLCNIGEWEKKKLEDWGFLFSYSNLLDLDVLLVDHWGTSWDYVMTDVEWSENFDECR